MFRRIVATILTSVLVLGLTGTAVAQEPLGPRPTRSPWTPTSGVLPNFAARGANLIRLQAGAFDPLVDALPAIPSGFALTPAANVAQYWIVQVADGRFADVAQAIATADALRAGPLRENAYIVRATPAQIAAIDASPAVRWSGLLQPAWRIRTADNRGPGLLELTGDRAYRIHLFRAEPDKAAARAAIAAIPGVHVASSGGRVIDVRATSAQLDDIAAVPAVEWVSLVPHLFPLNSNARWVIDTGVRDLRAATLDSRLTGAGQTTAVADTGVNYKPDQNGRAHIGFRDCSGTSCKEADYTQDAPGTDVALLEDVVDHNTNHRKMAAYFDYGATGPEPHDESSHGSHTAGSVTGDSGTYGVANGHDGMAPSARLVHQNMGTATGGLTIPDDIYDMFRQAYRPRNPADVPSTSTATGNTADYAKYIATEDARTHNNSWGSAILGIVPTDEQSVAVDQFVWDHEDMVIVVSAGNDGPEPNTVGDPAAAKNNFDSAASANGRQPMVSIDSLASFSSHGPTRDGRFGPTVATPGQIVVSAKGGSVDDYHYAQGTSMSGPVLTGATTLIRQYFWDGYGPAQGEGFAVGAASSTRKHNPSASLVRAAAVNGAVRMEGFYTGDDGYQRELDGQWPSAGQGFGLLNLDNSLYFTGDPLNNWYRDVWRADTDAFTLTDQGQVRSYTISVAAGQPLDVTLSYTDAPNLLPQGTPALVNNLDLTVTGPGGTYIGNNFNSRIDPKVEVAQTPAGTGVPDTRNNIERIRVAAPAAGTYTINVRGTTILEENQGFALAASGRISATAGGFTAGPARQADRAGSPVISGLTVEAISSDMAIVRFSTNEPTTATVTGAATGGTTRTWVDSYNRGLDGFPEYDTPNSETSPDFANRPVLSTRHEVLVTGLTPVAHSFQARARDLAGNNASPVAFNHTPPQHVFQPDADDEGNLQATPATPSPPTGPPPPTNVGWRTMGQMYAGPGILGAFGFRLPQSVDPNAITGAVVELTTGHQWTIPYDEDPIFTVDLLDEAVEPEWGTQTYEEIHNAPADARFRPETTIRDGLIKWQFSLTCADLAALKSTLAVQNGERMAAFRYDITDAHLGLLSVEPGFNRRSRGPQYRPRLILQTGDNPTGRITPCDPNTPAPTISDVGVHEGIAAGSTTVSWRTNVPSDSLVLFREKGTTQFTQVGSRSLTNVHQVQILGLDPAKDYEFGVRSAACNGATTTADNAGAGWDFFYPAVPPQAVQTYWFHGGPTDQADKHTAFTTSEDGISRSATFSTSPPDGTGGSQTVGPGNPDFVATQYAAYWIAEAGALAGPIDKDVSVSLAVSGNPGGVGLEVTFWTAVDEAGSETARKLGTGVIDTRGTGPQPALFDGTVHVSGVVEDNLLIQVLPQFLEDEGTQISYDTSATPSRFEVPIGQPPRGPDLPTSGPYPPPSAGATGLNLASVPTRATPTTADVAAGTARCALPVTAVPTISIGDITVGEAAGTAQLAVRLSQATSQSVTVNYATANNTARSGSDYSSRSGTVTFQPGETVKSISVPVINDTRDEWNENFFVNLTSPVRATIADARGVATITDNDPLPALRINDVTVTERDSTTYATFTVSLAPTSGRTVRVNFATQNGSATAPADYTARSGTLTFAEGVTTRTVSIAIKGENRRETTEDFFVNLTSPVNATLADARGRGVIRDDDPDDPLVVLTKSGPEEAAPGTLVRYTLSWRNLGPFASRNARMTDTLPADVNFYSASSGGTYDSATRRVTWQLGTVPTDGTGTRTLTVRVKSTAANGAVILNRVDFHGDQTFAAPAFARTTVRR